MAKLFEDICPRCLEPHLVGGDIPVGSTFCPNCQTLSFYGVPVNKALAAITAINDRHESE